MPAISSGGNEYRKLSKTPDQYDVFVDQISHIWTTQPNWSDEDLKKISNRVLIVDGDHDEAIVREHLEYIVFRVLICVHYSYLAPPDKKIML